MRNILGQPYLFENAAVVDGSRADAIEGQHVLVADGKILEVSDRAIAASNAIKVDLTGLTLMPGLIDCHVHVTSTAPTTLQNALLPDSLVALRAATVMNAMLHRGFTSVRDLGGADYGLVQALKEGRFEGPDLVICGKALSQSGGHADVRGIYDSRDAWYFGSRLGAMGRICDGVAEVRRAAREEIKAGATFIKIMANGGIASTTDPIDFLGFSAEEITAAVQEAHSARTYVAAHLYTDEAINRAVQLGVHCVEHSTFVTDETAKLMKEKGAVACPTLVTLDVVKKHGLENGVPQSQIDKGETTRLAYLTAIETLRRNGVKILFGTDIIVEPLQKYQNDEFVLRGQVQPAHEVIRSATLDAADLLKMSGEVGCVSPGARANLIVVRGNPLKDLALLAKPSKEFALIMKDGRAIKNELAA